MRSGPRQRPDLVGLIDEQDLVLGGGREARAGAVLDLGGGPELPSPVRDLQEGSALGPGTSSLLDRLREEVRPQLMQLEAGIHLPLDGLDGGAGTEQVLLGR